MTDKIFELGYPAPSNTLYQGKANTNVYGIETSALVYLSNIAIYDTSAYETVSISQS